MSTQDTKSGTAIGPLKKRARTGPGTFHSDTTDGAMEVGQGLQVTIPRAVPHAYNNNYTVRLTYADNYISNVRAYTGSDLQSFRMNSIYDPDYTGTGHQPYFRDMWSSQYDYYAVLACTYSIKMYNASGQDPVTFTSVGTNGQTLGAVNVTLLPTTNVNDLTNAYTSQLIYPAAEMKNAQTKWLLPQQSIEFHGTLTPGDFIVDAKDSDDDATWIATGSNPTVNRLLGYVISAGYGATPIGLNEAPYATIQVQVILDYDVQFTQINPTIRGVPS